MPINDTRAPFSTVGRSCHSRPMPVDVRGKDDDASSSPVASGRRRRGIVALRSNRNQRRVETEVVADTQGDRVALLGEVASALSSAGSVRDVMAALVESLTPELCDGCEVAMVDDDGVLRRVAVGPGDHYAARQRQPVPDTSDNPVRAVLATGEVVLLDADVPTDLAQLGPVDDPISARALGVRSAVIAPMTGRSAIVGVLAAAGGRARRFTPADVDLVSSIARLAGLAVENLRALDRLDVSDAELASSRARLDALVGAEVIGIIAGEGTLILEANRTFLDMVGLGPDALRDGPLDWAQLTPPEWRSQDDEVMALMARDGRAEPFEKEYLHADGSRVPVLVGGAALTVEPFRWIVYVADLRARRRAEQQARDANIRLRALVIEQHHVASVLQRSLLPALLPPVPGFEVAAHYWAEGEGITVGGDFYDIVPLGAGRFAILIGDVCGKGVEAAAVTAAARHTARAAAMHFPEPEAVLRWVHDAIAIHAGGILCTLAYAVLDTAADPPTLAVALAGHPQAILVGADGAVSDIGRHGTLLGAIPPALHTDHCTVGPGDLLAFYTDGITDAPGAAALDHRELRSWLAQHASEPLPAIGEALHAELMGRRPGGLRDDVALVLLRRSAPEP